MILIYSLIFFLSCIGLIVSSKLVVKSLIKVENYYHLREFVVSFLLIGVLTSFPELSVGVISALKGIPSLSFGDILGTNIMDIALVIGLVAIIGKSIKFEAQLEKTTLFLISAMIFLPLVLFLDRELSRLDGAILVSVFVLYVFRLFMIRNKFKKAKRKKRSKIKIKKNIVLLLLGLLILVASARLLVYAASEIALAFSFPVILIGLLVVSIGTSLPELFFELGCVLKGHCSAALGDLLGSLAFNSTFVLGLVALITPIEAKFSSFAVSAAFAVVSVLFFLLFARTGREIKRKEGVILIIIFIFFVIANIIVA